MIVKIGSRIFIGTFSLLIQKLHVPISAIVKTIMMNQTNMDDNVQLKLEAILSQFLKKKI